MNVAESAYARRERIFMSREAVAAGCLAAGAFALLFWGVHRADPHYYYAPAVRSMSDSWHAFVYGALDPAGSITLDKMPGAFWLQALSARLFGYSDWSIALPQALLFGATVLVLFDTVRAWAGAKAGLAAGLVVLLTPITVALGRINIPDTTLVFCQVCAAHATLRATRTERLRPLMIAAVWLGLAFQVKMGQAFAVLPSLGVTYLVAAPGSLGKRIGRGAAALAVMAGISMLWPLLLTLTPASARPYVDGSQHNSVWEMVFGYNGLGRFIQFGKNAPIMAAFGGESSWSRLFGATLGPQISWLVPFATLAFALGIALRRGTPRTDALRAGWILWGSWLLVHAIEFSTTSDIHPYYTATLAPAIAALTGAGFVAFAEQWIAGARIGRGFPIAVATTGICAVFLSLREKEYLPWVWPAVAGLTVIACVLLAIRQKPRVALGAAAAAMLLAPAHWALAASGNPMKGLSTISPVAGPVRPLSSQTMAALHGFPAHVHIPMSVGDMHMSTPNKNLIAYVAAHHQGERYVFAVPTANTAAPYLRAGYSVLPMGGFTGSAPMPTVDDLSTAIAAGQLRYVLTGGFHGKMGGPIARERQEWVQSHCEPVPPADYANPTEPTGPPGNPEVLFDCHKGNSRLNVSGSK
ncbi:glycosyltransferase family 39 protein [Pendulispora brunnea]|uniref:Glycosyltransferase family 39 protein n=1 Tax=Pendulispora brunnea TaxID=2905690 RepID=A0ABZ2K9U1_9BACT